MTENKTTENKMIRSNVFQNDVVPMVIHSKFDKELLHVTNRDTDQNLCCKISDVSTQFKSCNKLLHSAVYFVSPSLPLIEHLRVDTIPAVRYVVSFNETHNLIFT